MCKTSYKEHDKEECNFCSKTVFLPFYLVSELQQCDTQNRRCYCFEAQSESWALTVVEPSNCNNF